MKLCPQCGVSKDESEFYANPLSNDGLHRTCNTCCKARGRDNYQRNKSVRLAATKRNTKLRKEKAKKYIVEYLTTHPCVDCGESDIVVLDFDHVRGIKAGNIGHMISYGRPLSVIEAEVAKCDVRCANCHRRRTAKERGYYRTKPIPA